jgi:hypothetical protein
MRDRKGKKERMKLYMQEELSEEGREFSGA